MYGGPTATYSYCDEQGAKTIPLEPLLQGQI
jgi:hypothetical protein